MTISYKKLWHLLIDRNQSKQDLRRATGISTATMAKLAKCENVNTEVLIRICKALECSLHDIMELEEKPDETP